jgi:hypothetical protein
MRVYIAGPYTKGDVAVDIHNAVLAADALLEAGYDPFVPHLTHLWHLISPKKVEEWLAIDAAWLAVCDCVVRLPGESSSADTEVVRARALGIPVYDGLQSFLERRGS